MELREIVEAEMRMLRNCYSCAWADEYGNCEHFGHSSFAHTQEQDPADDKCEVWQAR